MKNEQQRKAGPSRHQSYISPSEQEGALFFMPSTGLRNNGSITGNIDNPNKKSYVIKQSHRGDPIKIRGCNRPFMSLQPRL